MRDAPAGDFDYESTEGGYATVRRPEPHFAAALREALGDVRTVVNIGAGAGSYEPDDLDVTPVEPSATMRAQRPKHLAPAIDGAAEALPFADKSFDAAMATVTLHQWRDLDRGLDELRRVTVGPIVILTFDPVALGSFWMAEYAPELMEHEAGRMPELARVTDRLGGVSTITDLPIPADCQDGFMEAFFGRPEALLSPAVRSAQSAWAFIDDATQARSVQALQQALDDGSWDDRHGHLRTAATYAGSVRLITARP